MYKSKQKLNTWVYLNNNLNYFSVLYHSYVNGIKMIFSYVKSRQLESMDYLFNVVGQSTD